VRLRELPCRLSLHHVPPEPFEVGGLEIEAAFVCHPGTTLGYRITERGRTLTFLPDHEPALGVRGTEIDPEWTSGFHLAENADLLIHDAQYTAEEYEEREGWGHSTIEHALRFAEAAGVARLVTFHHDPDHSDDLIDDLLAQATTAHPGVNVCPGAEGDCFALNADG
jgi:ribonuclease BN (tRNA processing enzyme)